MPILYVDLPSPYTVHNNNNNNNNNNNDNKFFINRGLHS